MLLGLLSRYRHSFARLWGGPLPFDGDDQADDPRSGVRVPLWNGPRNGSSAVALTEPDEASGEANALGKIRITNLSLGRAAARQKEIAIRLSLGASRARVVRQLLTQGALLAMAGGAAGLVLARLGRDALLTYVPADQYLSAPLDRGVLLFTMSVTVAAALLVGLVPAFGATKVHVAPMLKDGSVSKSSPARFRRGLVVFQIKISLVVIVGAVLFTRSFNGLLSNKLVFHGKTCWSRPSTC